MKRNILPTCYISLHIYNIFSAQKLLDLDFNFCFLFRSIIFISKLEINFMPLRNKF